MKVAVKLPDNLREIIQTFPLLHAINKLLNKQWEDTAIDDYEIHFICLNEVIAVLNLLPFKAFYHELEKEDLKNVFTMHRAIKNSKLDFIDIFISTTKSFVDASIGKNLNAPIRAGFSIGKNKVFINKGCQYYEGQHKSNIYFSLINAFGVDTSDINISNVCSRELGPIFADYSENPYIVINLKLNDKNELDSDWLDFFELFSNKIFVLCCDTLLPDFHDEVVTELSKKLNSKNTYKVFNPSDKINFGKMITYSKMFITFDSKLLYLAAYCGSNCYWLNEAINASIERPEYFYSDIKHYSLKEPQYKGKDSVYNLSPIFDEIYNAVCENPGPLDATK